MSEGYLSSFICSEVAIYVLPQQGYFSKTSVEQIFTFCHDAFCIPATLPASGKRHYAKRTHIITSPHNAYKCGYAVAVEAYRCDICISFFSAEQYIDCFLPAFGFG